MCLNNILKIYGSSSNDLFQNSFESPDATTLQLLKTSFDV